MQCVSDGSVINSASAATANLISPPCAPGPAKAAPCSALSSDQDGVRVENVNGAPVERAGFGSLRPARSDAVARLTQQLAPGHRLETVAEAFEVVEQPAEFLTLVLGGKVVDQLQTPSDELTAL